MHLHARAVELPFERRGAEPRERVADVLRRLGEHRLHRLQQPDREAREPWRARDERRARDRAEVAREHRGAPHVADRHARRGGDRLEHHALERALAQLADQQADEEVLLGARGAGEQLAELPRALARRAFAPRRRDARERAVDFRERERRRGRRGAAAELAQGRVADPEPALPRLAGEERNCDLDLVGRGRAQARRDRVALSESAAGLRHPAGGINEGCESGHRGTG